MRYLLEADSAAGSGQGGSLLSGSIADREAQLRAAFENPDAVSVVLRAASDSAGSVVDWVYIDTNRKALELLGLHREALIGLRLSEVLAKDRAERARRLCTQVMQTQEPVRYESHFAGRDLLVTLFPGGPDTVISCGTDITARKQAEAAVRDSERALRDSQDRLLLAKSAARLGIYDWDVNSDVIEWDERTRELWGVGPDEPVTYAVFLAGLHPEDRQLTQAAIDQALDPSGDGHYAVTYRVVHRTDGQTRWLEAIGRVFFDNGRAVRLAGIVQDVTARKLADEKLRESDRRKDEFLAMLAHELRNPIAPISNAAEVLSRHLVRDDRSRTLVAMIQRQTAHLARILDDLLDVARITQGRIELRRETVEVQMCVEHAMEIAQPLIKTREHRLTLEQSADPLRVHADKLRIEQCVANLVSNAAKYTDPKGEIRVRSYADGGAAVIEVSDNGIGISPEFLPRAFDLFAQSDRSLGRAQGGLGIGLSICKQLVEMHDGTIACTSAGMGQGSTFTIRLPLLLASAF